jgi:cytochrome oxidase assembly protein ShyY1
MRFRPPLPLTLALAALAAAFLYLGLWQLERKAEKEALFAMFETAPELPIGEALAQEREFARIEAQGRYDPRRHLLLDNRVWQGRAGVHVLTPFTLDGGRSLLVNRGWLPLPADRRALPDVPTDARERSLRGRLVRPSAAGPRLGAADVLSTQVWPQLVTYFDPDAAAAAVGEPLLPWVIQLDADDTSGFEDRHWQPAVMKPAIHAGYAVQWLALAATTLVIWIVLGLRRGRPAESRD